MRRRQLVSSLSLAAAGAAAPLMALGMDSASPRQLPASYVIFADWLTEAREAGMAYLRGSGTGNPEQFLRLLGLWASAMPTAPEPAWQQVPGANATLEMATLASGRPFVVSAFRMAPGCILPLHCHPGGGGITICRTGSLGIQHFDLCDDQPMFSETGAAAEVVPVSITQLDPGHDTWFTPEHANLHQFIAGPEGATGVEIAVQWRGAGEFSFLKLREPASAQSFTGRRRISGIWTGMQLSSAYAGI